KNWKLKIGQNCSIGSHVIMYEGINLGDNSQIEDFCRIGEKTKIGKNCRIVYGSKIYGFVNIGDKSVIGGFICEDVVIGSCCRIFGELVHKHPIGNYNDIKKWDK